MSASVGTTRSMPISATCTRGSADTSRAFPSFSTRTIEPVSATPKFAPVMPTSAERNVSRRRRRAVAVSSSRSEDTGAPSTSAKSSATCSAVFSSRRGR